MKKYLLILLIVTTPLIGQETRRIFYKRPVFGLNMEIGYSYSLFAFSGISVGIIPEFFIGKKRSVYFYLQLPLQFQGLYTKQNYDFFGFGILIGMGGYILEANDSNPWSLVMNGAAGGKLLFGPTQLGEGYNGSSTELNLEGIVMYLDFLARYHVNSSYALQFGPTISIVWPILPKINIAFKIGLAF